MDPQGRLPALPDGLACTVCEVRVPRERIRLLARRDGLAFVQSTCPACGSTSLGFLLADDAGGPTGPTEPTGPDAPGAVSANDVLEMHRFLEAWAGDLASLVGRGGGRA